MLIEEPVEVATVNEENTFDVLASEKFEKFSNYYIVCLSPSNYTSVSYPYSREAKPGMIFKSNGEMVQIIRVLDSYAGLKNIDETARLMESSQLEDECEKTLDHLPTNKSFLVEKEL